MKRECWYMLVIEYFYLVVFVVDNVVSRPVNQLFTCDFVTCSSTLNTSSQTVSAIRNKISDSLSLFSLNEPVQIPECLPSQYDRLCLKKKIS